MGPLYVDATATYGLAQFSTNRIATQGTFVERATGDFDLDNVNSGAPGILGLTYQHQTTTSVRSTLGGQAATTFQFGERLSVTPRLRAAWAHEFNADRQVNASFLSIPGAAFTINGARPARDAALVSAGVDVGMGRNVTVYAHFDGELAGSGNAYAGSGGLRVSW
jgi:outer membrane autotransporter protein